MPVVKKHKRNTTTQQIYKQRSNYEKRFIASNSVIKDYLRKILTLSSNKKQRSFYEWILKNGRLFGELQRITDAKMIKKLEIYRQGTKIKECYYNSQMLAINSPFDYYEGWYVTENLKSFPFEHGWNVLNGKVFDVTSYKKFKVHEYFGIHIPNSYLMKKMTETGMSDAYLVRYYYDKIYRR